jgi:glycerol-3-phosphate acyltransferase PlsX
MSLKKTIALDAMGGDFGPSEIVPAAIFALEKYDNLHLLLVGKENPLLDELRKHNANEHKRIKLIHAPEEVEMHESPSQTLRNKKMSSMRIAIEQVRDGQAAACVSAGNTGALMATSRFILKMLPVWTVRLFAPPYLEKMDILMFLIWEPMLTQVLNNYFNSL